ncbi:uncharacterized protein N7459_001446 [Penicillium hispanicum]|uniref:uncharacterized protein n=1 Tax=Penicillium hispanicum TaxID=1080232 RepID=UPI002540338B|nr:uncharacterized protein N7459_001446 [Penicillium hispanicum]KAJ5595238.1 hypothetical protein N7459_001446 [Penicillium hispanicum]
MSQAQGPGLADLEKELGCSICTELLYQPLTLLDCLHTFCGSCLKEWFSAQGSRRPPSGTSPRFTCPSCRAEVRGTRPNATVTTLLDMVLGAHPDQARSAAEKEEIAQRYKPGDPVFPPPPAEDESAEEDEDDRRMIEEVRELSLRESRAQARREARRAGHLDRPGERSSNTERHADDGRSRRRREDDSGRQQRTAWAHGDAERTRRIEHQSSLRSLLSLSSEAETMEEEILRQIIEEGLLNDIDLDNLGPAQEEELSERIADAYRRRHMQQPRSRQEHRRRQSPDNATRSHARSQSAQRPGDSSTSARDSNDRRPPVSRPHLLGSNTTRQGQSHQRRNSEHVSGRRQTSPVRVNQASTSEDALRPAVRSSSDMTAERPRSSQAARLRSDSSTTRPRRATESGQNVSNAWMGGGRERSSSRNITSQSATNSPTSLTSPVLNASHNSTPTEQTTPSISSPLVPGRYERRTRPSSSRSNAPASHVQYMEPSISCDRCGKANIQYELHKKCIRCREGNYHLCLRCYRSGRGCIHWDGFASSAQATFERMLASSNRRPIQIREIGHILSSFKYQRPPTTAQTATSGGRQMTNDNPAGRLEAGLFCDICLSSANECFWKCSQCNEGDWGFCNGCVNQGRCCTHPLLPVRRIAGSPAPSAPSTPADTPNSPSSHHDTERYKILSFSANCDICTYPIPASVTRFHCLQCNKGDYDVCTNCYLKLVATSKISKENGHNGWRRCLAGHRMIVVGFEDRDDGQRRVIVKDLVGGHALKDEHVGRTDSSSPATTGPVASPELGKGDWSWKEGQERRKKASRQRAPVIPHQTPVQENPGTPTMQNAPILRRFPPDGGVGLIVHALWSWYPEEEVEDELVFPRGANITEVENINDDWFWGCYAGRTGLFPGAHVKVVGEI